MPREGYPEDYIGRNFSDEVKNVNKLTLAFAKAVGNRQDDKSENLVISPYNALTALSMVAKAADDNTRAEMAQTLFGTGADELDAQIDNLLKLNEKMLDTNKDQVTLTTANGVWTNDDILTLNPAYADELKDEFGAEISGESFADPAVVEKINKWASDNTNGLIDNIIDQLQSDDFAILASALYFKGEWTHKFDKALTEDKKFVTDDGAVNETPMMHKDIEEGQVRYQKGDDFEAVTMTYGEEDYQEGKHPTMRILLVRPTDENVSARDWLAAQSDDGKIPAWMEPNAYKEVVGAVELPKMDMKNRYELIEPLEDMGIKDLFNDETCNIRRMITEKDEQLFVNKVTHDTVFKTDEEGSEAAAVTTIGVVRATSMPMPKERIDLKFDRSFVFALQDIESGAVIFAGAVNKPNEEMKPAAEAKADAKAKDEEPTLDSLGPNRNCWKPQR